MVKRKKMKAVPVVFGIVLLIVAVFAGVYFLIPKSVEQTGLPTGTPEGDTNTGLTAQQYLCSQQPTVNAYFRVKDTMQSSDTYLANKTGYWVPHGLVAGSAVETQTGGSDTSGSYSSSAATLSCGETYDLWVADVANTNGYGLVSDIVVGVTPKKITVETKATSALQARIKDAAADAYWYTDGDSQAFSNLADTWTNTSADVNIDAGSGGSHDLEIYVKTQTSKTVFGMADDEVVVAVDAPSTKWNEPSTSLGSNIKDGAHFDSYDLTALADYEYIYQFNQIGDTSEMFTFYITAVSGVDPGASDDIKLRFLAKGAALSDKDNQKIRKAYFKNDASFSEIQGSTEQITIDEVA